MNTMEMEKVRDRVHSLRARLSDTGWLLEAIARTAGAQDNETLNNIRIAIRTIDEVRDDLKTVCSEHLNDRSGESEGLSDMNRMNLESTLRELM